MDIPGRIQAIRSQISSILENFSLPNVNVERYLAKIEQGLTESMADDMVAKYCSEVAATMTTVHPDYSQLAAIICVNYHHSMTLPSFSEKIKLLQHHNRNINSHLYSLVVAHAGIYDRIVDYSRDYQFSYFAIQSIMRSYILRVDGKLVERPQDVYMRTAIQIHEDDFERVKETYDMLSCMYFTHATPTLFNSMLISPQLASCFLLTMKSDDIEGIFHTISDCAMISKHSGGIGVSLHNIRCEGSPLVSTGGFSKGIVPIARIINETMKYVNQGGVKRHSSVAFYLEPWHKDVLAFLDLRKNTGNDEFRARDVFTALWMNDLFMERVKNNEQWSLFDPNVAKGLSDVWGDDFRRLYLKCEKTVSRTVIPAQTLWKAILVAQVETGTPYIVYKDAANRLSNQNHLGTIKSSNLCAEILEYSSSDETAVCNLASISLPKFVSNGVFNFQELRRTVKIITYNLNKVIDKSFYPTKETRKSNFRHRPVGIGVQGLADVFAILRHPFESDGAKSLNKLIFETMYYAAIESSAELAKAVGPYETFKGSLLSQGIFHFERMGAQPSGMWDWEGLRREVMAHGTRNSLFIASMPTAGTSQIFGNTECFEPIPSNLYTRRTLAGEFQVVNKYLMEDLLALGLWSEEMRNLLLSSEGSIQSIPGLPKEIKDLYKTVWEIKMKSVIDMAADRQAFIDQSQSLNIYLAQPTYQQLSSMHFYGWTRGLKTGMYYLRTKPITTAIKFTVNQELVDKTLSSLQEQENMSNSMTEKEGTCESCSC